MPWFLAATGLLLALGVGGVALTVYRVAAQAAAVDTDEVLFLGAAVSGAFSLVVILCYAKSRTVRAHPNPLIFSKRCDDLSQRPTKMNCVNDMN